MSKTASMVMKIIGASLALAAVVCLLIGGWHSNMKRSTAPWGRAPFSFGENGHKKIRTHVRNIHFFSLTEKKSHGKINRLYDGGGDFSIFLSLCTG